MNVLLLLLCWSAGACGGQGRSGGSSGLSIEEYIADPRSNVVMKLTMQAVSDQDRQLVRCQVFPSNRGHGLDHQPTSAVGSTALFGVAQQFCAHFSNGQFNLSTLVYPGTKWCGSGDSARDYTDLGSNRWADSCCRTHDFCPQVIRPGQAKHGILNDSPFTISDCSCDVKLFECLRSNVFDKASNIISQLYFNVLPTKCFRRDHPIVACLQHNRKRNPTCLEYLLDHSQPKVYQLFDSSHLTNQPLLIN